VEGAVYQSVEKRDFFYVLEGDVMLRLGKQWAYSPGVGGFSMHAPKSRKFIVSLNFVEGGVPFLSSSIVKKGIVYWDGDPNGIGCDSTQLRKSRSLCPSVTNDRRLVTRSQHLQSPNQLAHLLNPMLQAPAFEGVYQLFARARIPEVRRTNFDCGSTG
jgi:hypothetical protein